MKRSDGGGAGLRGVFEGKGDVLEKGKEERGKGDEDKRKRKRRKGLPSVGNGPFKRFGGRRDLTRRGQQEEQELTKFTCRTFDSKLQRRRVCIGTCISAV